MKLDDEALGLLETLEKISAQTDDGIGDHVSSSSAPPLPMQLPEGDGTQNAFDPWIFFSQSGEYPDWAFGLLHQAGPETTATSNALVVTSEKASFSNEGLASLDSPAEAGRVHAQAHLEEKYQQSVAEYTSELECGGVVRSKSPPPEGDGTDKVFDPERFFAQPCADLDGAYGLLHHAGSETTATSHAPVVTSEKASFSNKDLASLDRPAEAGGVREHLRLEEKDQQSVAAYTSELERGGIVNVKSPLPADDYVCKEATPQDGTDGPERLERKVSIAEPNVTDDQASETSAKDVIFAVLRTMQQYGIRGFGPVYKMLPETCKFTSQDTLKGIYWALRVMCYDGACNARYPVNCFLRFLQVMPWDAATTYPQKVQRYQAETKNVLCEKVILACKAILSMDEKLYEALRLERIPIASVESKTFMNVLEARGSDCVSLRTNAQVLAMNCAKEGRWCHYEDFFPFIAKGAITFFDVCRMAMSCAFAQGLTLEFDENNKRFLFSVRKENPPEVCVPKEVLMAMRFFGRQCSQQERVFLANDMYNAGYPFASYEAFSSALDVTCLACNIRVGNARVLARTQEFWLYVQKNPEITNIKELKERYSYGYAIGAEELNLIDQAAALLRTGVFEQWRVPQASEALITSPYYYFEQKDKFLKTILDAYSEHKSECSYKVLGVFFRQDDPDMILASVMTSVFRTLGLHIKYSQDRQTYVLRDSAPTLEVIKSVKLFVLEKMSENVRIKCSELAYKLYCAGFSIPNFTRVDDLYNLIAVLGSTQAHSVLERCLAFLTHAVKKLPINSDRRMQTIVASFGKNHEPLSMRESTFACSFLRLCSRGVLSCQERDDILNGQVVLDSVALDVARGFPKKRLARQGTAMAEPEGVMTDCLPHAAETP